MRTVLPLGDELHRGAWRALVLSTAVALDGVSQQFGSVVAVDDVSLTVESGEFFSLLGPSGSGKTTCLRMIAGFDLPTTGRIVIGGEDVTSVPPYRRNVNTVFQDYALFPHMSVAENVAYPLMVRGSDQRTRVQRTNEMLELVQLSGLENRRPGALSGGQRQRVALARALINAPPVLLLDEPLGALDLKLRQQMQIELKALQRQLGITFIYVTHDQEEALSMSDRLAVFREGRIEQVGSPQSVYDTPKTAFVAGFVGSANILTREQAEALGLSPVTSALRPEKIHLHINGGGSQKGLVHCQGRLVGRQFLGINTRFEVEISQGLVLDVIRQNTLDQILPEPEQRVTLSWRVEDVRMLEPV